MKGPLLALYFFSILLLIYGNLFHQLGNDNKPGTIHKLYQKYYSSYRKYLSTFNKQREMSVPEPIRLLNFVKRLQLIEKHNERYEQGLEKYTMGLNEMSDWTDEERSRLCGYNPYSIDRSKLSNSTIIFNKILRKLPKSYDWRLKNVFTPIKNQGNCGVCFIFTAVAAVESHTAIKTGQPPEPLSEQSVMDCSGLEKCDGRGGNVMHVFEWIAKKNGIMAEKDYPFVNKDNFQCTFDPRKVRANVHGYGLLPEDSHNALKQALVERGPVAVGINALEQFKEYKQGIFYPAGHCSDQANHAVLIVGYGEENGVPYYILRNSWGNNWGEGGYGRVYAGHFICGLGKEMVLPLIV